MKAGADDAFEIMNKVNRWVFVSVKRGKLSIRWREMGEGKLSIRWREMGEVIYLNNIFQRLLYLVWLSGSESEFVNNTWSSLSPSSSIWSCVFDWFDVWDWKLCVVHSEFTGQSLCVKRLHQIIQWRKPLLGNHCSLNGTFCFYFQPPSLFFSEALVVCCKFIKQF